MKTIPQIREELLEVAKHLGNTKSSKRIKGLVKALYRRKAIRRAPTEHEPMTPQKIEAIKRTARQNPTVSYMVMAKLHKVSTGRISEVLAGKRAA